MMLKIVMTKEEVLAACAQWLNEHGADLSADQLKFHVEPVQDNVRYTVPPNPEVVVVADVEAPYMSGPYR